MFRAVIHSPEMGKKKKSNVNLKKNQPEVWRKSFVTLFFEEFDELNYLFLLTIIYVEEEEVSSEKQHLWKRSLNFLS